MKWSLYFAFNVDEFQLIANMYVETAQPRVTSNNTVLISYKLWAHTLRVLARAAAAAHQSAENNKEACGNIQE